MLNKAIWIGCPVEYADVAPTFIKTFSCAKKVAKASLSLTAQGVYVAALDGKRIGDYVLAPGWTAYQKRLQVQTYDITNQIKSENTLEITVAKGWYLSHLAWYDHHPYCPAEYALIGAIDLTYEDGTREALYTDESWMVKPSRLRFCEIYDGECYDASLPEEAPVPVKLLPALDKKRLIPQEGEKITEQLTIRPKAYLVTPKGERVLDFGQNMTGYIAFRVKGKAKDRVRITHFEILDKEGNVYTENYRSAKAVLEYTCRDGEQSYKTTHTFYGFRYIRLDEYPGEINPDDFEAIVVHSDIKRTGWLSSSNPLLNRLFDNVIWGQRGNFLDIPTDCPQRDERLGWTGDAQVFCRTATYQFDCETFFRKWFGDMRAEQWEDGGIPHVIPYILSDPHSSSAWGDAGVICPWQVYLTYGSKEILAEQFESMKRWVTYITKHTKDEYLWTGCNHFGDWCALDLGRETTDSASRKDLIASVYYANAADLVAKAGKALGQDVSEYEALHRNIVVKFNETYTDFRTQTEHALVLYFNMVPHKEEVAASLAARLAENGNRLNTGFVGTPYLLHALSQNGYTELAYTLLLQEAYPSWLFSVKQGATTIWEHWDGIKEDGSVWSAGMNSYNHYAYGAVADWVFGVAAGIQTVEEAPGFEKVVIAPHPDKRLDHLSAVLETRRGRVASRWFAFEGGWRYEIETPSPATIHLNGKTYEVAPGKYLF